jgi:hypothetical protein
MNADEFNARYPVGTPVLAYPGARPEDASDATRLVTRTRSRASVLGGHTDVVWVDGHSACIALTHVDPVTEEQFAEARAEETAAAVAAQGALPMPVGDQPQPLDDTSPEPIPARWDRTAILPEHPNGDIDGQTIVCCVADDGTKRPIGLFLDQEHREALGLLLVDPGGEDDDPAQLRAEVQRLKAELAEARTAALNEAADWFDQRAATEPDQGYRARVMRGAANDVRRLAAGGGAS